MANATVDTKADGSTSSEPSAMPAARSTVRRKAWLMRFAGLSTIIVFLSAWQIASSRAWIDPIYFPTPTTIAKTAAQSETLEVIWTSSVSTMGRFAASYGIAIVLGVGLGVLMGHFAVVNAFLEMPIELLRPIPSPAYMPMAILVLGIGNSTKIVVAVAAAFFPILLNTIAGVRNVNESLRETGQLLSFNGREELRRIILPASLPSILTGLRISLAVSLLVTVVAEMVAAGNSGLGFYILEAGRTFAIPEMYIGVVVIGALGFTLNKLFLVFESYAMRQWAGATAQHP